MTQTTTRRRFLQQSAFAGSALALSSWSLRAEAAASPAPLDRPVRLFANENAYGFSPRARKVLADSLDLGNQYAGRQTIARLKALIAHREGLDPENVVLGSGSGEVLCMAGAAFGLEGGEIVGPDPTFPLIYRYAEKMGAKLTKVPLNVRQELDLESMARKVRATTSLCYVCNPNNPTSTLLPTSTLRDFCRNTAQKTTVFVDEAYLEYTENYPRNSMVDLVKAGLPVIVTRTFSKIYGMAGLRIGYGLAPADLAERIRSFRMSWLNSLGVQAAIAAYQDRAFIQQSRDLNSQVRRRFLKHLDALKLPYAKPHGNFVWVRTGQLKLEEKMRPFNLLVRDLSPPLEQWIRITLGTQDQMDRFADALRSFH